MYHVSAEGVDERMINVHYYYYIQTVQNHVHIFGRIDSDKNHQHTTHKQTCSYVTLHKSN